MGSNRVDLDSTIELRMQRQHAIVLAVSLGLTLPGLFFLFNGQQAVPGFLLVALGLVGTVYGAFKYSGGGASDLALSPDGIVVRMVSANLIPWTDIEAVDSVDHTYRVRTRNSFDRSHTLRDVTVLWLDRGAFQSRFPDLVKNARIEDDGVAPDFRIAVRGGQAGIVIHHLPFGIPAEKLRQEITARLQAFGGERDPQRERSSAAFLSPGEAERFGRTGVPRLARLRNRQLWEYGSLAAVIVFGFGMYWAGIEFPSYKGWLALRQQERREAEIDRSLKEMESLSAESRISVDKAMEDHRRAIADMDKKFEQIFGPDKKADSKETSQQTGTQPGEQASAKTDVETAAAVETAPGIHGDAVVWLAVSPDGRQLASASTDKSVKLWDMQTATLIGDAGHHGDMMRSALFVDSGALLAEAGDDGKLTLFDLANKSVRHEFSKGSYGGIRSLAAAGDFIAAGRDTGVVTIMDWRSRQFVRVLSGHQWPVNGVALSRDGTRLVSGDIDGELRMWDMQNGELTDRWKGHERGVYSLVFLSDNRRILTASGDGNIKLWDTDTRKELRRFEGHSGTVYSLALSGDEKQFLSGSLDGSARLWNLETGVEKKLIDGHISVYSAAFGRDGSVLFGDRSGKIHKWDFKHAPVTFTAAK